MMQNEGKMGKIVLKKICEHACEAFMYRTKLDLVFEVRVSWPTGLWGSDHSSRPSAQG